MKAGWIVGIVTAWVILFIFSLVCDQAWFEGATLRTLQQLTQFNIVGSSIPLIGPIIGTIAAIAGFLQALGLIIFLKFDFWSGNYMILWYIFCLPVGIGIVVSIVLSVVGGARA